MYQTIQKGLESIERKGGLTTEEGFALVLAIQETREVVKEIEEILATITMVTTEEFKKAFAEVTDTLLDEMEEVYEKKRIKKIQQENN